MRIVLDTNVLASGLLSPYGRPAEIVRMVAAGKTRLCFDARVLAEYEEVLRRPKFRLDPEGVTALLEQVRSAGLLVAAAPLSESLPDPDDDAFVETALAAGAECIVTGNRDHYPKRLCGGLRVLSPAQFVAQHRRSGFA